MRVLIRLLYSGVRSKLKGRGAKLIRNFDTQKLKRGVVDLLHVLLDILTRGKKVMVNFFGNVRQK